MSLRIFIPRDAGAVAVGADEVALAFEEAAAKRGFRLVVSVDTGIRDFAAAEAAARLGLDLIVTDHHLPHAGLPNALIILNPNQPRPSMPRRRQPVHQACRLPCRNRSG